MVSLSIVNPWPLNAREFAARAAGEAGKTSTDSAACAMRMEKSDPTMGLSVIIGRAAALHEEITNETAIRDAVAH
jgi:hypothetical protein